MTAGFALLVTLPRPDEWRFLAWGAPAILIVAGAVVMEAHGIRIRGAKIGNACYAIYLLHTTAIAGLAMLSGPTGQLFVMAAALIAAVLGTTLHLWVERPLGRILRRPAAAAPATAI